jgi:hypothetical protein
MSATKFNISEQLQNSPYLFQVSFHTGQFACFNVFIPLIALLKAVFASGNNPTNPSNLLPTDDITQLITMVRRFTDDTVSLLTEHSSPECSVHFTHWLVKSS